MPPSSKQVEIDARWVYWRSFLLFFLVNQLIAWHRVSRLRIRTPGHRMIVFLLAPWATPQSFAVAFLGGAIVTVGAILIVRLIVRPLLKFWLNPSIDSSCGVFHLSASEAIVSTMPARRWSGWRWRPGSLTVTDRSVWFFPAAWDDEPWSLGLDEGDKIELERSFFAELAPIRNWPVPFHLSGRAGQHAVFAVADPGVLLACFGKRTGQGGTNLVSAGVHQPTGIVDV